MVFSSFVVPASGMGVNEAADFRLERLLTFLHEFDKNQLT
jgi:hypothetical protein